MKNNNMNFNKISMGIVGGVGVGMFIMSLMVIYIPDTPHSIAINAITECELNISRDKHCKIIAVIDEE